MALDSAKDFMKKFETDADFRSNVLKAPSDEERQKVVQQAGFSFTKGEIAQVIKEKQEAELSEDQLKAVAGGTSASWTSTGVTVGVAVATAGLG